MENNQRTWQKYYGIEGEKRPSHGSKTIKSCQGKLSTQWSSCLLKCRIWKSLSPISARKLELHRYRFRPKRGICEEKRRRGDILEYFASSEWIIDPWAKPWKVDRIAERIEKEFKQEVKGIILQDNEPRRESKKIWIGKKKSFSNKLSLWGEQIRLCIWEVCDRIREWVKHDRWTQ